MSDFGDARGCASYRYPSGPVINGVLLSPYDKKVSLRADMFLLGAALVAVLGMGMVLS